MSDHFVSQENKALVWQLLMDASAFVNIPEKYSNRLQNIYESIINETAQLNGLSLIEKNKLVISKMNEAIQYLHSTYIKKPLEEIQIQVNKNFKHKQDEFLQLINHNKPQDISFSEALDKPFEENELATKMNLLLNDRDYDG